VTLEVLVALGELSEALVGVADLHGERVARHPRSATDEVVLVVLSVLEEQTVVLHPRHSST
jgi:hypothetical protein